MGDFAAIDLWVVNYVQAGPDDPCAGCSGAIDAEDRCYGDWDHIWHSRCWPNRDGALKEHEQRMGRWRAPLARQSA